MAFQVLEEMTGEEPSPLAEEHFVPTRDGVKLATDVYLPRVDQSTKFSAVLSRTPYDKRSHYTSLKNEAEYFISRGYAFVAQDVRGKFRSTGDTEPYAYDVADGYDSVDWIVQQPWSDGRVGVVGASYYGFTTWATVASGHPAVKAAAPAVTGINMGSHHVASQWQQQPPSLFSVQDLLQIWSNNNGYLAELDYSQGPESIVKASAAAIGPSIGANHLLERSKHQSWYNPYGERHPYYTTQIPILHWQNWYDPGLAPAGLQDWRHFQSSSQRNLHFLRVGSADHSGYKLEHVGLGDEKNPYLNLDAMKEKISSEMGEVADFFDEHIRGQKPAGARPRAKWHIGHLGWQETSEYPPPSKPYALSLARSTSARRHCLQSERSPSATSLDWTHDPSNPVPSTASVEEIWYFLAAYPDERDLADREDVLTFRTEPFQSDLVFAGQPVLKANLAISTESAHLFVRMQDVYPDGTTRLISLGRMILTKAHDQFINLALDDNAYLLAKGHALQLQLAASDYPHFLLHPGTNENPWFSPKLSKIDFSLAVGGENGAELILPQFEV